MVLWFVTLKIGAFTKLGLFFPVVCFIRVFDQTLAEQLYHDKGLLINLRSRTDFVQKNQWNQQGPDVTDLSFTLKGTRSWQVVLH